MTRPLDGMAVLANVMSFNISSNYYLVNQNQMENVIGPRNGIVINTSKMMVQWGALLQSMWWFFGFLSFVPPPKTASR